MIYVYCNDTILTNINNLSLHDALPILFPQIRKKYPNQLFMADCSTYEEAIVANELGFDCVATTLSHLRNNSEKNTPDLDRKSTRLNYSHVAISYAVFCLKKKKNN